MTVNEYIIKLDFGQGDNYYISFQDDKWNEVYDPQVATVFPSKEAAVKRGLETTTFSDYIKAVKKSVEVKKFNAWASEGMIRRTFNYVDNTFSRPYTNESPEEVLDWWFKYHREELLIRHEDYKTWPALYCVFKHLCEIRRYLNEDGASVGLTVEMRIDKSSSFTSFKKELSLVIDKITLINKEGQKIINVFDHYLSEGGNSVVFLVGPKEKYALVDRYGEVLIEGSLKEIFSYWKKFRYYEE